MSCVRAACTSQHACSRKGNVSELASNSSDLPEFTALKNSSEQDKSGLIVTRISFPAPEAPVKQCDLDQCPVTSARSPARPRIRSKQQAVLFNIELVDYRVLIFSLRCMRCDANVKSLSSARDLRLRLPARKAKGKTQHWCYTHAVRVNEPSMTLIYMLYGISAHMLS